MRETVRLCVVQSQIEADALANYLESLGLRALVLSHYDSAYDGVWTAQRGWGEVRVFADDEPVAREALATFRVLRG